MGRKSKQRQRPPGGAISEEKSLQELQSHVNSLSLAEAVRAVQVMSAPHQSHLLLVLSLIAGSHSEFESPQGAAAKSSPGNSNREGRSSLLEKVTASLPFALKSQRRRKEEARDLYGDRDFWNQRYQERSVYEWYLPYDSLKTALLPELEACCSPVSQEMLVPGCGNSTLCEDLWASGEFLVAGADD